jgi:hypothetical protein
MGEANRRGSEEKRIREAEFKQLNLKIQSAIQEKIMKRFVHLFRFFNRTTSTKVLAQYAKNRGII